MADKMSRSDKEWRAQLSEEQYRVTRQAGTEPAFTGAFCDHKETGIYRCVGCNAALFASATKFDSGSGWPSFWDAADQGNVVVREDASHGMVRTEVLCARCDAHLGHLFDDGPAPSGQRYCINSAALGFEKK